MTGKPRGHRPWSRQGTIDARDLQGNAVRVKSGLRADASGSEVLVLQVDGCPIVEFTNAQSKLLVDQLQSHIAERNAPPCGDH